MGNLIEGTVKAIGEALDPVPGSKVVVMHPEWVRFIAREARCWLEELESTERNDFVTTEVRNRYTRESPQGGR